MYLALVSDYPYKFIFLPVSCYSFYFLPIPCTILCKRALFNLPFPVAFIIVHELDASHKMYLTNFPKFSLDFSLIGYYFDRLYSFGFSSLPIEFRIGVLSLS